MFASSTSPKLSYLSRILILPMLVITIASFAVRIRNSPVMDNTSVFSQPKLNKFLILVETTNDGIKLTGRQGCAFKELTFSLIDEKFQAIDQYGMSSLQRDKNLKESIHGNFLFTIKKTKEGLSFEGIEGTAWIKLSFGCPERKCHQFIDQNGMTEEEWSR